MQIAAVIANGAKNFPGCCSTNPVSAGPEIPAKLAKPFCQPYHFPTRSDPGSVWGKVYRPGPVMPQPKPAASNHGMYEFAPASAQPMRPLAAMINPTTIADFRTRVGV